MYSKINRYILEEEAEKEEEEKTVLFRLIKKHSVLTFFVFF